MRRPRNGFAAADAFVARVGKGGRMRGRKITLGGWSGETLAARCFCCELLLCRECSLWKVLIKEVMSEGGGKVQAD